MSKTIHNKYFYSGLVVIVILLLAFFVLPYIIPGVTIGKVKDISTVSTSTPPMPEVPKVKHQKTPEAVKGIYMSACVASTPSFREKLIKLADETEINSIVVDIKDYSGTISFQTDNPEFKDNAGGTCKVDDMKEFLETLHDHNIYVIGRITSFQDPYMAKLHPDWAVKTNTDKTANWKDRKGISYIDAGNQNMWKYLSDLAKESYAIGFDEINFDYIRFPSDGNMKDIYFPSSNETLKAYATSTTLITGKSIVLKSFFEYLHKNFADTDIVISADLFGMTSSNYDDLNIGQVLENAAPNFDYIAPMVYPSHYPPGFLGYNSVAAINAHPYEIVKYSMDFAVKRLIAMVTPVSVSTGTSTASTTVQAPVDTSIRLKLRPWLQDNDYPVHYTPEMVRAQIQAAYDAGLTSWMLWDAGNTYTQAALKAE